MHVKMCGVLAEVRQTRSSLVCKTDQGRETGGTRVSERAALENKRVHEVVVHLPKTMSEELTVAQARAALEEGHVHMLLITAAGRLLGTLVRGDLPLLGSDSTRALGFAVLRGRTVSPDVAATAAMCTMLESGQRRLAVVDEGGALLGLLCLKRRLTGFCSDADVQARVDQPR